MSNTKGQTQSSPNRTRSKHTASSPAPIGSSQKLLTLSQVKEYIEVKNVSPGTLTSDLWTWLHRACYQGSVDILDFLLDLNIKHVDNMIESISSQTSMYKITDLEANFVPKIVPVNSQDLFGRSALYLASSSSSFACVESIINYNSRMNSVIDNSISNQDQLVQKLKELLVFEFNLTNAKGQTALMCATRRADLNIMQILLESGADPNIQDDHMTSCLAYTVSKYSQIVGIFHFSSPTSHHSSMSPNHSHPTNTTSNGQHQPQNTSQRDSLSFEDPEIVRKLLECAKLLVYKGSDLSLLDLRSETVLHTACRCSDLEMLQMLLHHAKLAQPQNLLAALRLLHNKDKDFTFFGSISRSATQSTSGNIFCSSLPPDIASRMDCIELLNPTYLSLLLDEVKTKGGIAKMSTLDVVEWIVSLGLGNSKDIFLKNDITGSVLQQLSEETLRKDLGMESLGQRTIFIKRLDELKSVMPEAPVKKRQGTAQVDDDDDILCSIPNAESWQIPFGELVIESVIGRGYFGEVRRAKWKDLQVAIKTIYRTGGSQAKKDVYSEMSILAQLRHPNVLNFLGFVKHEGNVMMVTELMTGGALHTLIKNSFDTITRLRLRIVSDIVRGMEYLHSRKLVHRDLNTKNLLLDEHYSTKVSDFGLSRTSSDQKMTMNVGFLGCMAPEVYKGDEYTEKADVFSFAMVVYELVTGKEAHSGQENLMGYANMVANKGYRPPLDDKTTSPLWNELIRQCWNEDPSQRPSFRMLLDRVHNWPDETKPANNAYLPVVLTESGAYIS